MKKFLLAALPAAALLVAGCNDCEKLAKVSEKAQDLEVQVTGTMATPSAFAGLCHAYKHDWEKGLAKGAAFADDLATRRFYYEDNTCLAGHYEYYRDCDFGPGGPHHGGGGGHCVRERYFVCDRNQVTPHKKDGFEDAKNLSTLLSGTNGDLTAACTAYEYGRQAEGIAYLVATKIKLSAAQNTAETVATKLGCEDQQNRKGD
jgi:outer membrane murein-binding lipoprotein Lpp